MRGIVACFELVYGAIKASLKVLLAHILVRMVRYRAWVAQRCRYLRLIGRGVVCFVCTAHRDPVIRGPALAARMHAHLLRAEEGLVRHVDAAASLLLRHLVEHRVVQRLGRVTLVTPQLTLQRHPRDLHVLLPLLHLLHLGLHLVVVK